jgi:hypothetical protein
MKKNIFIAILIFLSSCSPQLKEKGEITLPNGEGNPVKVNYRIYEFPKFAEKYTMKDFESMAKKSTDVAKSICKNDLTFVPNDIQLISTGTNDSMTIYFDMTAKNGFGVPKKQTVYIDFVGTRYIGFDAF